MNITRDVVTDLLPLYFSGEASADTRVLVEAYFLQDPEFARLARSNPEADLPRTETPLPSKETEMQTLQRTRKLLSIRATLQGLAIFFTLLPFACWGDSKTGFHWLIMDQPLALGLSVTLAAVFWTALLMLRKRLSSSGI